MGATQEPIGAFGGERGRSPSTHEPNHLFLSVYVMALSLQSSGHWRRSYGCIGLLILILSEYHTDAFFS